MPTEMKVRQGSCLNFEDAESKHASLSDRGNTAGEEAVVKTGAEEDVPLCRDTESMIIIVNAHCKRLEI